MSTKISGYMHRRGDQQPVMTLNLKTKQKQKQTNTHTHTQRKKCKVKFSGIIEIDESLFGRCMKYHRGNHRSQTKTWVAGLTERNSGRYNVHTSMIVL